MKWFKRAWKGDEKLWKVFWLYGVLGYFAINLVPVIVYAASFIAWMQFTGTIFSHHALHIFVKASIPFAPILDVFLEGIYLFGVCFAVWKCAFNVEQAFWGYTARIIASLGLGCFLYSTGKIFAWLLSM